MTNEEHQPEGTEQTEEEPQQPEGSTTEPEQQQAEEEQPSELAKVRKEAAERRVLLREAETQRDAFRDRLRSAVVQQATAGILADATDLPWQDDFSDDDGFPDAEKIKAAAEALADAKPHLARARGDARQGYRGHSTEGVDLAQMLRG